LAVVCSPAVWSALLGLELWADALLLGLLEPVVLCELEVAEFCDDEAVVSLVVWVEVPPAEPGVAELLLWLLLISEELVVLLLPGVVLPALLPELG